MAFKETAIRTDRATRLATGMDNSHKLSITKQSGALPTYLHYYCPIMAYGANKYDYANFEVAPFVMVDALESLSRHITALSQGETVDPESHCLHIGHMVARVGIVYMKHHREVTNTNPTIGWHADHVESIIYRLHDRYPDLGLADLILPTEPKPLWSCLHVTEEMVIALGEMRLWQYRNEFDYQSVLKTLQAYRLHLLSIVPIVTLEELQLLFDLVMVLAYLYTDDTIQSTPPPPTRPRDMGDVDLYAIVEGDS